MISNTDWGGGGTRSQEGSGVHMFPESQGGQRKESSSDEKGDSFIPRQSQHLLLRDMWLSRWVVHI